MEGLLSTGPNPSSLTYILDGMGWHGCCLGVEFHWGRSGLLLTGLPTAQFSPCNNNIVQSLLNAMAK